MSANRRKQSNPKNIVNSFYILFLKPTIIPVLERLLQILTTYIVL